jgi:hypothetical protein
LSDWGDLKPSVSHFISRYQDEHGEQFVLDVSTDVLEHLIKLHRALRFPRFSYTCTKIFYGTQFNNIVALCRGNCILVGSLGQPLKSIAQISLYIAGYELQFLDVSCESKFKESFRGLFRQTGLEGKALSIIITVSINTISTIYLPSCGALHGYICLLRQYCSIVVT